jgi:DNA-binding NarL/FixJ family response regulator
MDGLARAIGSSWDVIALDLHLPDVLGITVLSELRQHDVTAPVIVMTGWYLNTGHDEAAVALGAAGFVRKPIEVEELGGLLRSAAHAAMFSPVGLFPQNKARQPQSSRALPSGLGNRRKRDSGRCTRWQAPGTKPRWIACAKSFFQHSSVRPTE